MNSIITENVTNKVMSIINEKLKDRYTIPFEYDDTLPSNKGIKIGYHRTGKEIMEMIDESLVKSYPPNNVIDILKNKYNICNSDVFIMDASNDMGPSYIIVVLLPITTDKQTIGDIKHFMRWSGYFLESNELKKVGDKLAYCFEPKFGYDISDYICEEFECLYHVTPTKYVERIKKYKKKKKSKNKQFEYPDRIYLMAGNTLSSFQRQILWFVTNNIKQDNKNPKDNHTFSLLTIDTEKIPYEVRLYADPTSQGAVFTHDNIPPTAITRIENFTI